MDSQFVRQVSQGLQSLGVGAVVGGHLGDGMEAVSRDRCSGRRVVCKGKSSSLPSELTYRDASPSVETDLGGRLVINK